MQPDTAEYKKVLGFMESSNNYKAVNGIGALGKYQFMPTTLNALKNKFGLTDWQNTNYFLNNPDLQEQYENALIVDSLSGITNNELDKKIGLPVNGSMRFKGINTRITVYGLLGAIHLSGIGNVVKYFKTGYNPNDGFTSLTDYLAYFSQNVLPKTNINVISLAIISFIVLYYL